MKLRGISVISEILKPVLSGKKFLVCLGAQYAERFLLTPFCSGNKKKLPMPKNIYDYLPDKYPNGIMDIPVLPLHDLKLLHSEDAVILVAAEDQEFYSYLGELYDNLHCYYFPILPCTSIEAYFYALDHKKEISNIYKLFSDAASKTLYKEYWESRISGRVYDPMLFSGQAYWGNDLISHIPNNGTIVLGGAYNGLHIDRAQTLSSNCKAVLFEPNPTWAEYLEAKYINCPEIRVISKALYNRCCEIPFDTSNELGAQVRIDGKGNCIVETSRLDDLKLDDITIIALDIEGTELEALEGASRTIAAYRPILAICAYHKISDYLDIPRYINNLGLEYNLYFRQHSCYYEESVIYAIPQNRCIPIFE